jgi:hypothetical protein
MLAQAHVLAHIQAHIDKTGFAVLHQCFHRDVKTQAQTAPIQMLVLAIPFGGLVSGPKALRFGGSWPFFRLIKFFSDTTSPDCAISSPCGLLGGRKMASARTHTHTRTHARNTIVLLSIHLRTGCRATGFRVHSSKLHRFSR